MENDELARSFILDNSANDIEDYLDSVNPESFDAFVSGLIVNIHKIIQSIEAKANDYFSLSEDALSSIITTNLEGYGYKAENETQHRGRVDITVEKDGFTWLIEAKIGYNNPKIFEGLLQLASRYLTNQRSAGLFIYYQKKHPTKQFNSWRDFIEKQEWIKYANTHSIIGACNEMFGKLTVPNDKLCVNNTIKKVCFTSAGSKCNIYSFGVNCYFKPVDTSGRGSASLKKKHAKLYIEHAFHDYSIGEDLDIEKLMDSIDEHFSCTEET